MQHKQNNFATINTVDKTKIQLHYFPLDCTFIRRKKKILIISK